MSEERVDGPSSAVPVQTADARETAHEYAWKWFEYHAGQRMTVFRFFLIVTGAVGAGCLTVLQQAKYGVAVALALLLVIFAFLFWRLDCRNRELVKISEAYLKQEEERLSVTLGDQRIRLTNIADQRGTGFLEQYIKTFRQVYQWIFVTIGASAFAILMYSLSLICEPKH